MLCIHYCSHLNGSKNCSPATFMGSQSPTMTINVASAIALRGPVRYSALKVPRLCTQAHDAPLALENWQAH